MKKTALLVLVLALTALLLAACGGLKTVEVLDGAERTEVTVKKSATVQDVLAEAGITLGEKDEVSPGVKEKPADGNPVTVTRFVTVNIVTENGTKTVEMLGGTVADALEKAGITLAADESLNWSPDTKLYPIIGDIVISKVVNVTLTADGKTETYSSKVTTVEDFLGLEGIEFTESDRITPALDENLSEGMEIVLQRVTEKTETVKEEIPFETKKENSSSLEKGKTKTKQAGANGEKEVTYKIVLVDGEEESREVLEEKVLKEAVTEIILVGSKAEQETGANGKVIVSKVAVPDCDGSGHGYYVITYADGSVEYVDY